MTAPTLYAALWPSGAVTVHERPATSAVAVEPCVTEGER